MLQAPIRLVDDGDDYVEVLFPEPKMIIEVKMEEPEPIPSSAYFRHHDQFEINHNYRTFPQKFGQNRQYSEEIEEIEEEKEEEEMLNEFHPIGATFQNMVSGNLEEFASTSGCTLHLIPSSKKLKYLFVSIRGPPKAVETARALIDELQMGLQEDQILADEARLGKRSDDSTMTIYVPVPEFARGYVIGRRQAMLRKIEHTSGLCIVEPLQSFSDLNAPFKISGDPEAVRRAKKRIEDLIRHKTAADAETDVVIARVPSYTISAIMGPNGENFQRMSDVSGAALSLVTSAEEFGVDRRIQIEGNDEQIKAAMAEIQKVVDLGAPMPGDAQVLAVVVPEQFVGRVAGKRGTNVQRLSDQSGAKCLLQVENGVTRMILSGGVSETNQAQYLLLKRLEQMDEADNAEVVVID